MKVSFFKLLITIVFIFFLLGLWKGVFYYQQLEESAHYDKSLLVLLSGAWISQDVIKQFKEKYKIEVTVDIATENLDEIVHKKNYDIIGLVSHELPLFIERNFLKKINLDEITNERWIVRDFLYYDHPYKRYGIPLFWNIETQASERKKLKIYHLSLMETSLNQDEAYQFINYLLDPEVSLSLLKGNHLATVHNGLDKSSLAEERKSSYLRKISLSSLEY